MAKIGITVEISRIDAGAVSQARQNFEYGLSADWFQMDIPDPDEILTYILDATNGGAEAYYTKYHSAKMSKLLQAAAKVTDQTKRQELYTQVQQLAAADLPQVPLFNAPAVWALSDQVHGFEMLPTATYRLQDVWLSK